MKELSKKTKIAWSLLGIYVFLNFIIFALNPFASKWHYYTQDPKRLRVMKPPDKELSIKQIVRILDSIDLVYGVREPTDFERAKIKFLNGIRILFLPSTIAQEMKTFVGYIGPANERQEAFTISVKERYNYLADLAVEKGYEGNGFLFQLDAKQSKSDGFSFEDLRGSKSSQSTNKEPPQHEENGE